MCHGDVLDNSEIESLADLVAKKPRALVVSEVADLLRISGRQVYKLAAEARIPYLKIAGSIRFDPGALAVWLRQRGATCPQTGKGPARTITNFQEQQDRSSLRNAEPTSAESAIEKDRFVNEETQ